MSSVSRIAKPEVLDRTLVSSNSIIHRRVGEAKVMEKALPVTCPPTFLSVACWQGHKEGT